MSSMDRHLAKLEHAYVGLNLKLETSSSIKISSPLAATFPFSSIFRQIENIISSGTWVGRGTGLRLVIQLLIDQVIPSYFDRPTFLEGLGVLLCNAEIWPQLSLQASLVPPTENSSETAMPLGELVLTLAYSQTCSNSKTNVESPNVPIAQYASPPASVPYAYLDEVKLVFEFSAIAPASKRRRLGLITKHEPDSDMLFGFRDSIDSMESTAQPQPISNSRLQPHLWLYNFPVKKLHFGQVLKEPSRMGCFQNAFAVKAGIVATPRGKRFKPNDYTQTADIIFSDLALLIDVGLRSMISDNIVTKPPNIRLLSNSGGPKLTEISPGLFSPGYMHALSQRNSLLPTIARAMPLIYRRARSPRLKDKIERLLDVSPEEYISEDLSNPSGHQNTTSALTAVIKARLWKLSQRKLFDHTAARRLKPLGCIDSAFEQSVGSQVILEEGYVSSQGRDIIEESCEVREMLDEGYCSQETILKVAREHDDLLFEESRLGLEEELWANDLLFDEEEAEIDDGLLDDDLFWEEDTVQEFPTDEGLFHNEYDNIEDEVLDDHTHHISNELADGRFGGYTSLVGSDGREEEMLLSG